MKRNKKQEEPLPEERRSIKRIKISYYLPIVNAESYEQLGILSEITTKGLMVDSQKLLPIDKVIKLRLDLGEENFDQPFINFSAKVKWVIPDRYQPSFYNIGFEIQNISINESRIIELIVNKYGPGDKSL